MSATATLPRHIEEGYKRQKTQEARTLTGATVRKSPAVMPDLSEWIQENFYLYDSEQLITLYDCQLRPLRLAMEREENGNYKYNTILWSWPKKSAKSSVVAAVVDYLAWNKAKASIKLIANDREQADSKVGMYLRENLKLSPRLGHVKIKPSGYAIEYDNGSRVQMVPIDPEGEAGGNDDLLVYSELWGWKSKAHQQMWSEMTLSPNKFGNSQRWIDTYSGRRGESPVLANLFSLGVEQGRRVWDDLEVYVNDTARLLCVWVTEHLLPWQTNETGRAYYAEQASTLTPNEFARMHKNQWVSSVDQFVPLEWWEACRGEVKPIEDNEPCILVADAGVSNDSFGVLLVSGGNEGEVCTVRYAHAFIPPKGGKINFAEPEGEIRRLIDTYNVSEFVYDPYMLEDMASRFKNEMLCHCHAFNQSGDRLIADKGLHDAIQARRVLHSGEPSLRDHIQNANASTVGDDKMRIVKRDDASKVDLAVCLSMGRARVKYWRL